MAWLPAHCSESAVGVRELSNGRKFDMVDLTMNAIVDSWAKGEASSTAPSSVDVKVVETTTDLVDCLARWIGLCTLEANHFPAPGHFERVKFIRDTTASSRRSSNARLVGGHVGCTVAAVKRAAPSAAGVSFVPVLSSTCDQLQAEQAFVRDSFSLAKRAKLSHKQVEKKADAVFLEHWHERKRLASAFFSPPVSAAARIQALTLFGYLLRCMCMFSFELVRCLDSSVVDAAVVDRSRMVVCKNPVVPSRSLPLLLPKTRSSVAE